MNIAVFCSGNGSNFQAIVDARKRALFSADIAVMICDNPDAYAVKRAEKEHVPFLVVNRKDFSSKKLFEDKIINELESKKVSLICLAGYIRVLSPEFIRKYAGKIINIHPALLPAFKGASAIEDAFEYGCGPPAGGGGAGRVRWRRWWASRDGWGRDADAIGGGDRGARWNVGGYARCDRSEVDRD